METQGDRGHWPRRVESWAACDPDPDSPGLAGEVGCVRGQALPCMVGATGLSRRIFPKKKKTLWGTLGNSPAATSPVSYPPHHPVGDCAHLILEGAESTGTTRREGSQLPGVCLPTGEGLHLISEGTETTRTRESANQGRLCMHTHSLEKAYHKKKKCVEAGNTRIPPRRGNPPTKETPTDKNRRW